MSKTFWKKSIYGRQPLPFLKILLKRTVFLFPLSFVNFVPATALEFYTDIIPVLKGVEISYEIPIDQLQFVTQRDGFLAEFNFLSIIEDEKGEIVKSDYWKKSFNIREYEETLLESSTIMGTVSLSIPPGFYLITTRVEDLHSSEGGFLKESVQVPDLLTPASQGLALSGIKFLKKSKERNGDDPNPRRTYGEKEKVAFLIEVYTQENNLLTAHWNVEDPHQTIIAKGTTEIQNSDDSLRERKDGIFQVYPSRLEIPHTEFEKGGDYLLHVLIESQDKDSVVRSEEVRKMFTLDYSPFTLKETYLEKVKYLEYLATPEEMKVLKNAPPEDWEKVYREFWKKYDPTPHTERNELEENYFKRVEFANMHYTPPEEGWRSDRGRIYIKFGPPDEVRQQPFSVSSNPYEIWYYYGPNFEFVFLDEHGIGRYKLVNREEELRADRERQ